MERPEHEKLKYIQYKSQAIHEFIEWLSDTKDIRLMENYSEEFYENNEDFADAKRELDYDFAFPIRAKLTDLVAEFYDIDLKKLEDEKLAMLEEIRRHNDSAKRPRGHADAIS